eukprot:121505_1
MGNEQSNKLPKYQEGDRILTNDNNKGYIKKICTRNNEDGSVEFGYGVAMDNKVPHGHDGQGDFKCKPGHGVIVAEDFIKLKLDVEQSRPHSHNKTTRKKTRTKKQESKNDLLSQIDISMIITGCKDQGAKQYQEDSFCTFASPDLTFLVAGVFDG